MCTQRSSFVRRTSTVIFGECCGVCFCGEGFPARFGCLRSQVAVQRARELFCLALACGNGTVYSSVLYVRKRPGDIVPVSAVLFSLNSLSEFRSPSDRKPKLSPCVDPSFFSCSWGGCGSGSGP